MSFHQLKISKQYIERLNDSYIYNPTEVQEKSIPMLLSGHNTIVKAQTGTGKTLAFLLPILSMLDLSCSNTQVMILTPTRELADQIVKVGKLLTKGTGISVVSLFGGHRIQHQIDKVQKNAHIIVGTPGRILDHSRRGTVNLKYLKQVVIDEADQMLAYGFIDDIYLIHSRIPSNQQLMLFSATMPDNIQKLISDIMPNAKYIEINPQEIVVSAIKQMVVLTTEERKMSSLLYLLDVYNPFMAIVFTKSKERAKEVYENLLRNNVRSIELLHGELSQSRRERIIKDFRNMKTQILISTDISARGLDVQGITHIFNYDVPRDVEYYVHRIGRTGRMGDDGCAITLMDEKEERYLLKIERYTKIKLQKVYDRTEYERSRLIPDDLKKFIVRESNKEKRRTKPFVLKNKKNLAQSKPKKRK